MTIENSQTDGQSEQKIVRFDWAIKNILRNKANFDILEGFLSELLKEQIKIVSLLESESNQEHANDKYNRVDLLVQTATNEKIIIEVQTASEWDFWHRILFGTSKLITQYIERGQPYSIISKVISVSILFFNLGVGTDYIYKGSTEFCGVHNNDKLNLSQDNIDLYIDNIQKAYKTPGDIFPTYYLIQLKKFGDKIQDKFDEWVYLLKHEAIKKNFSAQGIRSAKEKLDILKLSESDRMRYEKHMESLSYEASLIETHHVEMKQAKKKSKAEGREEALKDTARNLKKLGIKIEDIIAATHLTAKDIEQL